MKETQKEKKITIRFFLRKDRGTKIKNIAGVAIVYYPLYVEIIHRRKINRCKSRFYEFGTNKNHHSLVEYSREVERLINGESQPINTNQFDLLDLLVCEKKHIFSVFKLLKDISDEEFLFSNLSEAYHYSLRRRVYDLYDEVLKELLLETLQKYLPFHLVDVFQRAMPTYKYSDFTEILLLTVDMCNIDDKYSIENINRIEVYILGYFTSNSVNRSALTIPIWVIEGHQNKLEAFLLDESRNIDSAIVSNFIAKLDLKIAEEVSSIKHFFKS